MKTYADLEKNFNVRQKHPIISTLLKLTVIIFYLAHYNACLFYKISVYEDN